MTPGARVAAAIEILDIIRAGTPAEAALTRWARGSRFAGSKDRAAVRDHVYDVMRRWRSCAALGGAEDGLGLMLGLLRGTGHDPDTLFNGEGHAPNPLTDQEKSAGEVPQGVAASDLPDWLWPQWQASLGDEAAAVAEVLRHRAPVMLRVNMGRTSLENARKVLAEQGVITHFSDISPSALIVSEGARRVALSEAFLTGLIELQDGASQALVDQLPVPSGSVILDFCAGGGGKSLAMSARFDIPVLAHDANVARMKDLPARAARAGARVEIADDEAVRARAPFGLVLTDVPCSGSGAWRRAPEGKWTLTQGRLDALNATQDAILDEAADLVAPGGVLAYATCSVLACENQSRISAFLARRTGWQDVHRQSWLPGPDGDGFFLAILAKCRQ